MLLEVNSSHPYLWSHISAFSYLFFHVFLLPSKRTLLTPGAVTAEVRAGDAQCGVGSGGLSLSLAVPVVQVFPSRAP